MQRPVVIAVIVGLVVGLLAGFLWWGTDTERLKSELAQAQKRTDELAGKLGATEAEAAKTRRELETVQARLKSLEEELGQEKSRRSRLETILSRGKK